MITISTEELLDSIWGSNPLSGSISAPHAGSWLRAILNVNVSLVMSPKEFVVSLHLWLGLALFQAQSGAPVAPLLTSLVIISQLWFRSTKDKTS